MSDETSIFISHSHENKLEALEIKEELELHGFDVHIDDELAGGRSFVEWINNTMEQSTCLVLIWSNHSAGSYWQNREWRSYLSGKVRRYPNNNTIISIRIGDAKVPLIINDLKWFDYDDDSAESARKIASSLRGVPVEN
ncbi:MAG: toll/interleukin-1 receptor domain-containing protein, partial [Candidatus Thorarchaeota archaeon]